MLLYFSIIIFYSISNIYITTEKIKSPTFRVIGGNNAHEHDFPYVVSMELEVRLRDPGGEDETTYHHLCTASALTSTWSLTAGHCVTSLDSGWPIDLKNIFVKGVLRYNSNATVVPRLVDIRESIAHINMKTIINDIQYSYHDIGLVRSDPIKLEVYGKLSPVDYKSLIGYEALIAGYGLTNESKNTFGFPRSLNKSLQVAEVLITKCDSDITFYPVVCLGAKCGKQVLLLSGDSGGPLVHSSGIVAVHSLGMSPIANKIYQANFISFQNVGFDTPVSPYIDWIAKVVSKEA